MSNTHFDAIIVGSGFGGSVTAYRLAEAGLSVCVPERGKVAVEYLVGVASQGLADDLDGEDLKVGEPGAGPRWRMRLPLSRSCTRQL